MWGQPPSAVRRAKLDPFAGAPFLAFFARSGDLGSGAQPSMTIARAIHAEGVPLFRVLCERVGRDAACTILPAAPARLGPSSLCDPLSQ